MTKKKPKHDNQIFIDYAKKIVKHPNYLGMPDPIGERGEIQWEAPSNRKSGKFKDTHHLRREWWKKKAISVGIDPDTNSTWISATAKLIHPFGKKPCKTCGKELEIAYAYPNEHFFRRIKKLPYVNDNFQLSEVEHICELLERMHKNFGDKIFGDLGGLLETTSIKIPSIPNDLEKWKKYLLEKYIPQESRVLSPGAMSNPPDRLDGFHSFNRCCRATSDTGRTKENLKTYVTDRRVFEYWVDGDWVAADRLMGEVRSNPIFTQNECFNTIHGGSHPKPCQADHIGPISLGFSHRPQFQLLCKNCNSGKNNRMYASDVKFLVDVESSGESVISWFAQELWNLRKNSVSNSETGLRLSKLLRDNRHTYMSLLKSILDAGHNTFLVSLLSLEAADFDPEFKSLNVVNHVTAYGSVLKKTRTTKYAIEQKARRIRIAFSSLNDYHKKENRSAFLISNQNSQKAFINGMQELKKLQIVTASIDKKIGALVGDVEVSESELRELTSSLQEIIAKNKSQIEAARNYFLKSMNAVGRELSGLWDTDRYVRTILDEVIE
jgi:Alw26I/Eco31I/Esp3I family type II restriction endonuclease